MNTYRHTFAADCPADSETIIYRLEIRSLTMIHVEHINTATALIKKGWHEQIADRLAETLGGDQTIIAIHQGVEIETKSSLVELQLSSEVEAGALRVAAFLISYYGTGDVSEANEPTPTITTRDRLALVTVTIKGTPYVIVDICLRMLQPAELNEAQVFPGDYIISHGADGRPFTKTQQVHMCGNSVSPPPMAALARANDPWRAEERQAQAA